MRNTHTPEQRLEALQSANAKRIARARLRRDLDAGLVRASELILDPPEAIVGMVALDALRKLVPGMTPLALARINRLAMTRGINLAQHIERLSLVDRQAIARAVDAVRPPRRLRVAA